MSVRGSFIQKAALSGFCYFPLAKWDEFYYNIQVFVCAEVFSRSLTD